jgi:hypothetical protein
LRIKNRNL